LRLLHQSPASKGNQPTRIDNRLAQPHDRGSVDHALPLSIRCELQLGRFDWLERDRAEDGRVDILQEINRP